MKDWNEWFFDQMHRMICCGVAAGSLGQKSFALLSVVAHRQRFYHAEWVQFHAPELRYFSGIATHDEQIESENKCVAAGWLYMDPTDKDPDGHILWSYSATQPGYLYGEPVVSDVEGFKPADDGEKADEFTQSVIDAIQSVSIGCLLDDQSLQVIADRVARDPGPIQLVSLGQACQILQIGLDEIADVAKSLALKEHRINCVRHLSEQDLAKIQRHLNLPAAQYPSKRELKRARKSVETSQELARLETQLNTASNGVQ